MELYYGLIDGFGLEVAEKYFEKFSQYCIEISDDDIKNAMKFRAKNKTLQLSYIDCLGYLVAQRRNLLFLTGDKSFKNLPNVKFVK